ncbi:hypothetical protein CsSME_00043357 [Camellia sinensis var. sinensis]
MTTTNFIVLPVKVPIFHVATLNSLGLASLFTLV